MTNPISGIYLFKIEYSQVVRMTNGDVAEYKQKDLITISYTGKSGIVRAFHGYGDKQLAKVGGYGYDKIHTALAHAIEKLTNVKMEVDGGAGFGAVREYAEAKGITVRDLLGAAISL